MIPIINQNVKRTDCEEAFSLIALVTNILLCSIIGFLFVGYYYKSYIDNIIETKQKNNEDVETYKKYIEESYTLQLINNNIQIIFGIILVIKFFFLNDNDYYTTIYEFFLYLIVNIWFTYLYVHFALRKCNIINCENTNSSSSSSTSPSMFLQRNLDENYYTDFYIGDGFNVSN